MEVLERCPAWTMRVARCWERAPDVLCAQDGSRSTAVVEWASWGPSTPVTTSPTSPAGGWRPACPNEEEPALPTPLAWL